MDLDLHIFHTFKIYQPKNGYRFSMEPFILAKNEEFVAPKQIVDFGSGCGIIAILLAIKNPHCTIYAIEQNRDYMPLIEKNLKTNGIKNVTVLNSLDEIAVNSIDLFISNPPYFDTNCFRPSKKFESEKFGMDIKQLITSAKRVLKNKGRLKLIYHPTRFVELFECLKEKHFGLKSIQPVYGSLTKDACCFIIEAMLGSPSYVRFLPPVDLSKDRDLLTM